MQAIPVADRHQMKAFQSVIRVALGRILDIFIILILSLFPLSSFPSVFPSTIALYPAQNVV